MPRAAFKPCFMKGPDWKSETFEPSRDWGPGRGANQLPWPHSIRLATGGEFHVDEFPASSLIHRLNSLFRRIGKLMKKRPFFSTIAVLKGPKSA